MQDLAAKQLGVAFLDAHVDVPYNRTGIVLAANDVSLVKDLAPRVAFSPHISYAFLSFMEE